MTDQPNGPEEKKIIIDEDWKSKVEDERDQQKRQQEEQPGNGSELSRCEPASGSEMSRC